MFKEISPLWTWIDMNFLLGSIWPILSPLVSFVLILSPLVFIHELGHYAVAKWHGIHVEEFSIGMGPRIVSWTDRSGTKWSLSWLLIGGYVRMLGDGDVASSTSVDVVPQDRHRTMEGKTSWQRIQVALAGPAANYALSFILFMGLFTTIGKSWHQPVVQVASGAYAYDMGIRSGDRIVGLGNAKSPAVTPTVSFEKVLEFLALAPAIDPITMHIQRHQQPMTFVIPPVSQAQGTWLGKLGMRPALLPPQYTTYSVSDALSQTMSLLNPRTTINNLKPSTMGGPIAIAQQTQSIWQGGWAHALYVMATLSLGLGFFNLLPLPILDGGMVVLELIQWATGRPLPPRVRSFLSIGAVMAIGTLMVFLSWQDILRIPSVARFFGY